MSQKFHLIWPVIGLVVSIALVGYGFVAMIRKSYEPRVMLLKWAFTIPFVTFCIWAGLRIGPGGPVLMVVMAIVLTYVWVQNITELIAIPFTSLFDGGDEPLARKPLYSIATAKRKRGLYPEAIEEVRKQLKRFPNDFEGIMLLAGIQAENLQDLHAASMTLGNYCALKKSPDKFVAAAWTQLADWQLKLATDVDAARASLQKIVDRYPGTELSLRAEQRLAHLGETEKILMDQHDRPRIVLKEGVHNLGLRDSASVVQPGEIPPGKLAEAYVKQLQAHPHDSDVREKLAIIYARDFKRLDLATMELAVLINETRHSAKQIAGWLNLLANFQVELGADVATVRETLQKIVDRFPELPLALVTQRRLARLESEFKGRIETPDVKLGTYEQNIGLKYGNPAQKPHEKDSSGQGT
jgi:tetratricopeptide (TPR) repeat protein